MSARTATPTSVEQSPQVWVTQGSLDMKAEAREKRWKGWEGHQ